MVSKGFLHAKSIGCLCECRGKIDLLNNLRGILEHNKTFFKLLAFTPKIVTAIITIKYRCKRRELTKLQNFQKIYILSLIVHVNKAQNACILMSYNYTVFIYFNTFYINKIKRIGIDVLIDTATRINI